MNPKIPPFSLNFEELFLKNYSKLRSQEQKAVDKCVELIRHNPRHPSLNTHKAKNVRAKYSAGGSDLFIAYASMELRVTFEYGPEHGMISIRNCGHHDRAERKM